VRVCTVDVSVRILVRAEHTTGYVDAGKYPSGSRIGQNLGRQLSIGCRIRSATDRSGRNGCAASERGLIFQQLLSPLTIHDEQHQIDLGRADLDTPAAFCELHEGRRTPAVRLAATHHTSPVLATDT